LNEVVSEAFVRFFVEIVGHYSLFLTSGEREERTLQREAFRKAVSSKSLRRFLEVFMETQTFRGFIQERELRRQDAKGWVPSMLGQGAGDSQTAGGERLPSYSFVQHNKTQERTASWALVAHTCNPSYSGGRD
jgi:hypothetical protein